MKKIGLLVFSMCVFFWGYSQPKIQFDETTHDFGEIKEVDGKVNGKFIFTNVGDSVLELISVKPSCGCTAANYTKEPVMPNGKGFIDATYDPSGRPGPFMKSVVVTTNESANNVTVLFIKGNVEKRPPTVFEEAGYFIGQGMVRFKEINVKKDMLNTESQRDTLLIKNFGETDAEVTFQNLNEKTYIKEIYRSFKVLKPNEEGKIVLEYDAAKRNAFGLLREDLKVSVTDEKEPNKIIFYNVNIKEDFSKMTKKEREQAPVIAVDCLDFNFGEVKRNETAKIHCTIVNNGKSPLIIHNMQPSVHFVNSTVKTATIPSGESLKVEFTYRGTGRKGEQKFTIDVICNDPANSVLPLQFQSVLLD
jgi:hypothetical protein